MIKLYDYLKSSKNILEDKDIINDLITNEQNKVLSASQGKVLNDKFKNTFPSIKKCVTGLKNVVFSPSNPDYATLFTSSELEELLGTTITNKNVRAICENYDITFNHAIVATYSSKSDNNLAVVLKDNANGTMSIRYMIFLVE